MQKPSAWSFSNKNFSVVHLLVEQGGGLGNPLQGRHDPELQDLYCFSKLLPSGVGEELHDDLDGTVVGIYASMLG